MIAVEQLRQWCFESNPRLLPETADQLAPSMFRAMAYFFHPRQYPAGREDYRLASARELAQSCAAERVFSRLIAENIRFAPIKGMDISRRYYPNPALRSKCDIDLLTHRDDLGRAVKILEADGWMTPYDYVTGHHEPSMYKNHVMLEMHHSLPGFGELPENIWRNVLQTAPDGGFRLPPELNLLLAFQHARGHRWCNGPVLLADCGFLLRREGAPDWTILRRTAHDFGLPSPEPLFAAFPDFFPAETMPPDRSTPDEVASALRTAILSPVEPRDESGFTVMNQKNRFSLDWWKKRISGMSPASIRFQCGIPHGGGLKLACAYCHVIQVKMHKAVAGLRDGNDTKIARIRRVESIEDYLRSANNQVDK